jgi:hypothetical protein
LASETVNKGFGDVPRFVDYLKNCESKEIRKKILDQALKLHVLRIKTKHNEEYKPSSMEAELKKVFAILNKTHSIGITMSDFNETGTFRGTISEKWTEIRKENPAFGVKKGKSKIVLNDVGIVNQKLKEGVLKPFENPHHLKLLVIFIFLRLLGLRKKDVYYLTTDQLTICVYDEGPDAGRRYLQVKIDFDKASQLRLGNTSVPDDYGECKLRDNPFDTDNFNAFEYAEFYLSKLTPGESKVFKQNLRRKTLTKESPIWYGRQNCSEKIITNCYRSLGEVMGVPDFSDCTSHAGRAGLITSSQLAGVAGKSICKQTRHAGIASLTPYSRNTLEGDSKLQDAMHTYYDKTKLVIGKNTARGVKRKADSDIDSIAERLQKLEDENKKLKQGFWQNSKEKCCMM